MSVSLPRPSEPARPVAPRPNDAILFAVQDDLRNTLRMVWLDPDIRTVTAQPVFFTAAWSAVRPNVTRSFTAGADGLREVAEQAVVGRLAVRRLDAVDALPAGERAALIQSVQAMHFVAPRVLLVLHAWTALARRQRIAGTGREEPPAKRGIPEWQAGVRALPRSFPEDVEALLDEATVGLGVATTPPVLQAVSAWPEVLRDAWRQLRPRAASPAWREAQIRVRRRSTEALRSLPHPMELQWDALSRRGLTEDPRRALADRLTRLAASAPVNLLVGTFLWTALGRPELPPES